MYSLRFLMKNISVECRNPHLKYKIVQRKFTNLKKPFWLPVAKSKEFRVPKVVEPDPVEQPELDRLSELYEVHLHSLRTFINQDESFLITAEADKYREPEANIKASYERNEEWNKQSANLRKVRLDKMRQEEDEEVVRIIEEAESKKKELREKIAKIAQSETEKSKTFIKKENIEEAVEQCLASTVSYNFAIDTNGNVYKNNEIVDNLDKKRKQISQ